MHFNVKEDIIALTPQWKGERFPDGRPRVADKYLEALRHLTLEEVWKPIFVKGYESQFEGRLHTLHDDGRKLVGRAVTATFAPSCAKRMAEARPMPAPAPVMKLKKYIIFLRDSSMIYDR